MSNIVKETRERLGMTQQQLAHELQKSLRTVAGWEAKDQVDDPVVIMACERLVELKEQS